MELKMLSEESLTRQPEEVFDILSKLGEGSYGSVYKAIHKESSQVLAIKQVPVDTDLQEIIKEISIMQQCDSPYVVKYYGSYFKNTDLWIVMEYCGAGSVLDIMKLRGLFHRKPKGEVVSLTEEEIATILCDTLKGLEYLHLRKKIHRDIKAGNILLNSEGHAKLADFGVAGQLTDTMAKRNTVIGTPFWMAPEVIQEIGYDCVADIWSLGITALELAEGRAPYGEIHPMRAIFMIPSKPPPSFNKPDQWSSHFIDFVSRCLVKNPEERASASQLLQHDFIELARSPDVLASMIQEAQEMREQLAERHALNNSRDDSTDSNRTMLADSGTLIRHGDTAGVGDDEDDSCGTMIQHGTLVPDHNKTLTDVESNMGTMVINEDEGDDDTMKRHSSSKEYRPAFMDHFERKDRSTQDSQAPAAAPAAPAEQAPALAPRAPVSSSSNQAAPAISKPVSATPQYPQQQQQQQPRLQQPQQPQQPQLQQQQQQQQQLLPNVNAAAAAAAAMQSAHLQRQLEQIAGGKPVGAAGAVPVAGAAPRTPTMSNAPPESNAAKCQRSILEGDLDFLKYLSNDDLTSRLSNLDFDMEREIDDLRRRYHAKRQPILDAMDQKRKRQQNF